MLQLKHGLAFTDLYSPAGLSRLDAAFVAFVAQIDEPLAVRLRAGRADADALPVKDESQLLLDLAPHLDDFIGDLFGIASEVKALQARHAELAPLYTVKRNFVQRRSLKGVKPEAVAALDGMALAAHLETLFGEKLTEMVFARHVAAHDPVVLDVGEVDASVGVPGRALDEGDDPLRLGGGIGRRNDRQQGGGRRSRNGDRAAGAGNRRGRRILGGGPRRGSSRYG